MEGHSCSVETRMPEGRIARRASWKRDYRDSHSDIRQLQCDRARCHLSHRPSTGPLSHIDARAEASPDDPVMS